MDKSQIERLVGIKFLDKFLGKSTQESMLIPGDVSRREPDLRYYFTGIEVGACVSEDSIFTDKLEPIFLEYSVAYLQTRLSNTIKIGLDFTEDVDLYVYRATKKFEDFAYLWKFLDRAYIHVFATSAEAERLNKSSVFLNSRRMFRQNTFPNLNKQKEVNHFLDELVRCTEMLKKADSIIEDSDQKKVYAFKISEILEKRTEHDNLLKRLISDKIIDKLKQDKYHGDFDRKVLLLHNYTANLHARLSSDRYFYLGHADEVISLLRSFVEEYDSKEIWDNIFFLDFSKDLSNRNFDWTEF